MQYEQFVGHVQHRARLASESDAVAAIRATLETLAERLVGGAAANLAAQLPREIGAHLQLGLMTYGNDRMTMEDFFQRVSEREPAALADAIYHARVVIEVLGEAVKPGSLDRIRAQLPEDYLALFQSDSAGRVRAAQGEPSPAPAPARAPRRGATAGSQKPRANDRARRDGPAGASTARRRTRGAPTGHARTATRPGTITRTSRVATEERARARKQRTAVRAAVKSGAKTSGAGKRPRSRRTER